jgi:cysteine desulfuration protein SufE
MDGDMKLDDLLNEFNGLDPEERLELLIDFAETLPELSSEHEALRQHGDCRVQECQTPVFLWVDVIDGRVRLAAHVPEKSPTVRGFLAMLVEGLSGETPGAVESVPDDIVTRLGLEDALGMTRQRGFKGIVSRIKHQVALSAARSA